MPHFAPLHCLPERADATCLPADFAIPSASLSPRWCAARHAPRFRQLPLPLSPPHITCWCRHWLPLFRHCFSLPLALPPLMLPLLLLFHIAAIRLPMLDAVATLSATLRYTPHCRYSLMSLMPISHIAITPDDFQRCCHSIRCCYCWIRHCRWYSHPLMVIDTIRYLRWMPMLIRFADVPFMLDAFVGQLLITLFGLRHFSVIAVFHILMRWCHCCLLPMFTLTLPLLPLALLLPLRRLERRCWRFAAAAGAAAAIASVFSCCCWRAA